MRRPGPVVARNHRWALPPTRSLAPSSFRTPIAPPPCFNPRPPGRSRPLPDAPLAPGAYPNVAGAPLSTSTCGTATEPSSCWRFSMIAISVLPTATAVPLSVATCSGAAPSAGR